MSLPAVIIPILAAFEPVFTQPTWHKALVLLIGTLLAHGRRTVAACMVRFWHPAPQPVWRTGDRISAEQKLTATFYTYVTITIKGILALFRGVFSKETGQPHLCHMAHVRTTSE